MARYRVGVVFGSRSTEHEVSIITAMQVIQFLSPRHDVVPIYVTKDGAWLTSGRLANINAFKDFDPKWSDLQSIIVTPDKSLKTITNVLAKGVFSKPQKIELDVVFPALHGLHGEDGTIQGLLELCDIPFVGSGVLASSIGMDKVVTKAVLKENGLPILDYVWFTLHDWEQDSDLVIQRIRESLPLPVIVKPARLGSSIGVQKANSVEELQFAIDVAIHYDTRILVERYVENKMEVNCAVLGNENPIASVCEQPISRDALLSYNDKYLHSARDTGMEGASRVIPAPISSDLATRIGNLAIKTFRSVGGLGTARIDFIIDQQAGDVYVNELNTMPGSIAHYLWKPLGISPEELVDRLIDLAFEAHRVKSRLTYSINTPLLQQADILKLKK